MSDSDEPRPGYTSILQAHDRLQTHIIQTPLIHSDILSRQCNSQVYLKLENLQRSGSFKIRGATNAILRDHERARQHGVITASAGNHAQGVAYGAQIVNCDALVIMPEGTPDNKILATRRLGAEVRLKGSSYEEAYEEAERIQRQSGRLLIHPFDQYSVIEGQATCAVEITRSAPEPLSWIMVPVGGGGLCSGICLWMESESPDTSVIPVQSAQGSSLKAALEAGEPTDIPPPRTVAEGIATSRIGRKTFEILRERAESPILVSDDHMVQGILHGTENERLVIEGAGAAGLAALRSEPDSLPSGPGCVVISGGNLDVLELAHLIDRGLRGSGRLVRIQTKLPDRPGALADMATLIGDEGGNIQYIHHDRSERSISVRSALVEIEISVRSEQSRQELLDRLEREGYPITVR